jgi:hypothetical protein
LDRTIRYKEFQKYFYEWKMADNLYVSHFIYLRIYLVHFKIEPVVRYNYRQSVLN